MAKSSNKVQETAPVMKTTSLKIFFYFFVAFSIFILAFYSTSDKGGAVRKSKVEFIEQWTVTDDKGEVFTTGKYFRDNRHYDGEFKITCRLPENISDNSFLCFTLNGNTRISVGGEFRWNFIESRDVLIPGGQVKRFYATVPLYASDSGKELLMVRTSFSRHPEVVPETFITDMSGVYSTLFDKYGVSFVCSAILLIFSLIILIIGIILRFWYRHSIGMFYGALSIFVIAAWLVTNSYLYPFVFGHYHVDGIVNYLACLIIPFGLILYLDFVQEGRYRKIMIVALLFSAINAAAWTILHFTEIFPFYAALLWIDVILGILVVSAIVILLVDLKRGNMHKYRYTAIGFMGFLFFCIVEIIVLTFFTLKQDDIPMLIGLTFFLTFVVMQQIEDLRKINQEKQHAIDLSDAKTKFLANMSHEIRTPINSILGMNEMILRENNDKTIDGYAHVIKDSGRMLLTLVNDVLDFSRIEAGHIEITNDKFSLSRVLSDTMAMMSERAEEKGLQLTTTVLSDVPDGLYSDEFRLRQVLINLLGNAVKYTDKGSVELLADGHYISDETFDLKLTVKDTGRGIKEEDLGSLFTAFSRVDLKANRNIEGTGLGLAIVKNIADSMQGTVAVESEYGKGSSFTFTIPVNVFDKTSMSKVITAESDNDGNTYRCDYKAPDARILAVDDNRSNLTIVKLFLKTTGITPDLCSSGTEAIKLCKENKYDLLLLDHMMPSPNGIESLELIRKDPDSLNRETPAVVLTANAIAGSRQLYIDAGFADYLTKPLDSKKLETTIRNFLPKDKIIPVKPMYSVKSVATDDPNSEYYVEEFYPTSYGSSADEEAEGADSADEKAVKLSNLAEKLPGFDHTTALMHCGGDENILFEILRDVAVEGPSKIERMKKSLSSKDWNSFMIDAHALKSVMATTGFEALSNEARAHELAIQEGRIDYIENNSEALINGYKEVCNTITELLG